MINKISKIKNYEPLKIQKIQKIQKTKVDRKKLSYNYVKDYIEKEGYQLLSKEYINANTKLLLKCPEGHEYKVKFSHFKNNRRCPICRKLSYNYVKSFIEKDGYQLLSKKYTNSRSNLLIKCPKGHEYNIKWNTFQQGHRCPICMNQKLTYKHVKDYIEKEGYQLLSKTYKNVRTKLLLKCPIGHEYKVKFNDFQQGQRCPFCSNNISKGEIEVQNYIESLGYDIVRNDRTQILNPLTGCNLELDIWIPSLNKAIEYNGSYWHSLYERKKYDEIKKEQCIKKNIDLLIVVDEKWTNYNDIERERIKQWLLNKHYSFYVNIYL